ncbi:MAG: alpha/beta fold hydrolase, partial [Halobacteriaceae archaeon]
MVEHDGRRTAYEVTGDEGPAIACVHGSGGTGQLWRAQRGRLDPAVVTMDLSGHGVSDDIQTPPGRQTLTRYARDVVAVVEQTEAEILIGNSLGGAVLIHALVALDVSPRGVILIGSGAKLAVLEQLRSWLHDDWERAVTWLHEDDRLFHDADPRMRRVSMAT